MVSPFDLAWSLLKAPIDYHGYSDLPNDMGNQEERDFHNWMAGRHPQYADPKSEEGRRYQKERMGSPEDEAEIMRLIDEFNAQYSPPDPTQ